MKKQIGWRDGCELPVLDQKCWLGSTLDRKSTRLNSSHSQISYAVFCLKKKKHALTLLVRPSPALSHTRPTPTRRFAVGESARLHRRGARHLPLRPATCARLVGPVRPRT